MVVIIDEKHSVSVRGVHPSGDQTRYAVDMKVMAMAELVCMIKKDTYEVLKDRFTGECNEYPLDEFPEFIIQRLITSLKLRDQISTDELNSELAKEEAE